MAGHSQRSHDQPKGFLDLKRGRLFSKLAISIVRSKAPEALRALMA